MTSKVQCNILPYFAYNTLTIFRLIPPVVEEEQYRYFQWIGITVYYSKFWEFSVGCFKSYAVWAGIRPPPYIDMLRRYIPITGVSAKSMHIWLFLMHWILSLINYKYPPLLSQYNQQQTPFGTASCPFHHRMYHVTTNFMHYHGYYSEHE